MKVSSEQRKDYVVKIVLRCVEAPKVSMWCSSSCVISSLRLWNNFLSCLCIHRFQQVFLGKLCRGNIPIVFSSNKQNFPTLDKTRIIVRKVCVSAWLFIFSVFALVLWWTGSLSSKYPNPWLSDADRMFANNLNCLNGPWQQAIGTMMRR